MTNITATATGVTGVNAAINNHLSSSPTMTNVTAVASGGANNHGVSNSSSSAPIRTNVSATASGGTKSWAINNKGSSAVMTNVTASASGGSTNNYGFINTASTATIRNSSISGTTNSIINASSGTANVAGTMLGGGAASGTGFTCVGAFNAAFAALSTGGL